MPISKQFKTRSIDSVDFSVTPTVEGVVLGMDKLTVGEKDRAYMTIDTGANIAQVWYSHALSEAFELAAEGDNIKIEFHGKVKLKSGHSFNKFSVQVWTETGTDDAPQES